MILSGILKTSECLPGYAFNPAIGHCDWPYNVPGCGETHHGMRWIIWLEKFKEFKSSKNFGIINKCK